MIEELLCQAEGKTIEFKENTKPLNKIMKTIVSFANTAGGTIIIGVKDGAKQIIGIKDVLQEEERLANAIADSVEPLLIPDIEIHNYRDRDLLVLQVPHMVGPYYLKALGDEKGVFVRLGSTNRQADNEMLESLRLLSKNVSFDELPCVGAELSDLDDELLSMICNKLGMSKSQKDLGALGFMSKTPSQPTMGAILLIGKDKLQYLPDSTIRCVCFKGTNRSDIIDQKDFSGDLLSSIDGIIAFIERHTSIRGDIGRIKRSDVSLYPEKAIRESVINSIVHADYSLKGSSIQIAVFANRVEITNPGALPFGQTLDMALSGISKMRNRVIGRLFHKLRFIDKLGSGLQRIVGIYENLKCQMPIFEEIGNFFRITLFSSDVIAKPLEDWQKQLIDVLSTGKRLGTKEIAKLWDVSDRTTRTRLSKMLESRMIIRLATSSNDPFAQYSVP